MLRIEHLTKHFGDKTAVDDLSLHIAPGEIYVFIGHNGAGKTTTLKSIAGILRVDSGEIVIDGHSVREAPLECKKRIAYITDNPDAHVEEIGSNGNKVGRSLAENANSMRLANDFGNAMNNGVQKVKAGATSVYNALYDYFNNPIQIDPVSTTQNGLEFRDVEGDELDELLGKKIKE